jgi:crotonobetainyl-CoA:carnitine CoA-transferase CaiB-like acyl-CoA transferase
MVEVPDERKPLAGLRIIEMGSLIAGPFAGRMLADFGAEVIKIEAPGKLDPLRSWGAGEINGNSLWWAVQSRGKRLITLNLRVPKGQRLLVELLRQSDVLIENFRPGTLERWGLAPDVLLAENPKLVIARISGEGQTGPRSSRPGFAATAEALSGLRYLNGFPGGPPPRHGLSTGDTVAAMFAFDGIMTALYWRDTAPDGRGQVVDVALTESCMALLESTIPDYDRFGVVREPAGTGLANNVPSNLFRSMDGRWVVIAANTDVLFRRLSEAMGRPELADDPRFATHAARSFNQAACEAEITAWTEARDAAEIEEVLSGAGIPTAPVNSVAELVHDEQLRAREMLLRQYDPDIGSYLTPGITPKLSETPGALTWSGRQTAGADNELVFGELLGLSPDERAALAEEGVT